MRPTILFVILAGSLFISSPVAWAQEEDFDEDLNQELLDEEDYTAGYEGGGGGYAGGAPPPQMDEVRRVATLSLMFNCSTLFPPVLAHQQMKAQQKVLQHVISVISEECRNNIMTLMQLPPEEQKGKVRM
jgi:hypothetical protein